MTDVDNTNVDIKKVDNSDGCEENAMVYLNHIFATEYPAGTFAKIIKKDTHPSSKASS